MGIFPRLCHSLLRVPVAACPSRVLSCQDTSNQQGKIEKASSSNTQHPQSPYFFCLINSQQGRYFIFFEILDLVVSIQASLDIFPAWINPQK